MALIAAFLGTMGIFKYLQAGYDLTFSGSFISLLVFAGLWAVTHNELSVLSSNYDRHSAGNIIFSYGTAYVLGLCMTVGAQLDLSGMTAGGFKGKFAILVKAALLALAFFPFISKLVRTTNHIIGRTLPDLSGIGNSSKVFKTFFFKAWGLIFAAWFPVFLAYYPAVMTYDFHRQSQEAAKGFIWFNSYQPLAHTFFIWISFQFGKLFNSPEVGMAFYSIIQMLILSASLGYAVVMIYRLTHSRKPALISGFFFALCPFISVLSVSATKDVLFAAFFVTFICLFIERTFFATGKKQLLIDILWVADSVFMSLFRNNAVYAIIVFTLFYVLMVGKGNRLRAFIIFLAMSLCGITAPEGLQRALGTTIRGSKVEAYSVIVQSVARVGYYHINEMDADTFLDLDRIVGHDYWALYNPIVSDPVKSMVAIDNYVNYWKDNMSDVFKTWLKYSIKYPNEYIDASLQTIRGFWYPDDRSWAEVWIDSGPQRGALTTANTTVSDAIPDGIDHKSKFPFLESIIDPFVSANGFMNVPVVSNIFKPATYTLAIFFLLAVLIKNKRRNCALIVCFVALYTLSMFLGPIVQARYALPMMCVLPVLLALLCEKTVTVHDKKHIA